MMKSDAEFAVTVEPPMARASPVVVPGGGCSATLLIIKGPPDGAMEYVLPAVVIAGPPGDRVREPIMY